jgi:hypothetical protein
MFLALALTLAATPVKVAATPWAHSGLDPTFAGALQTRFIDLLGRRGLHVTSPDDIAAVLGVERQKELLGCSEASCTAELAGALGVDVILNATVVRGEAGFTATLRAVGAKDARVLASLSERLASERALQDWLDTAAEQLASQLMEGSAATSGVSASSRSTILPWSPAILGGALAIGGVITFFLREGPASQLRMGGLSPDAAHAARVQGQTLEQAGVGLMIAGGVLVAAGVVWRLLSPGASSSVALIPVDGGSVLSLSGTF